MADFPCNGARKYKAAKAALHASGAAVVEKEWPMEGDTMLVGTAGWKFRKAMAMDVVFCIVFAGKILGKKDGNIWESHKLNEGFIDGRISEAKWRIFWACSVGGAHLVGPPTLKLVCKHSYCILLYYC